MIPIRIKNKLVSDAEINVSKVLFWIDSKIYLKYIKNNNKRFSYFAPTEQRKSEKNLTLVNGIILKVSLAWYTIVQDQ